MGLSQLTGFTVQVKGRNADLNAWPVLMLGLTSGGIFVPLLVDSTGALLPPSGGGYNVTVVGPLGPQTAAESVAVTQGAGAANLATAQVATATSQVAAAIARPTRTSVVFQNLDATITIYVGVTGLSSSTGVPILAGQARVFTWAGAFFAVSASGTPTLSVSDEYN